MLFLFFVGVPDAYFFDKESEVNAIQQTFIQHTHCIGRGDTTKSCDGALSALLWSLKACFFFFFLFFNSSIEL